MDLNTALSNWKSAGDKLTLLDNNLNQAQANEERERAELAIAVAAKDMAQTSDDEGAAEYDAFTDALIQALIDSKRKPVIEVVG